MIAPNYVFNLSRSKIGPKKFVCRALKVAAIFTWGVGSGGEWLRERPPIMSGVLGLLEMGFLQLLSRMNTRTPIIVIYDAQPSLN